MNKYYILKGSVVRFDHYKLLEDGKMEIGQLHFLKSNNDTVEINETKDKWRNLVLNFLNKDFLKYHDKIQIRESDKSKIFEFETDEEALLYEELLE